jgi:hypothetical protein
MLSGWLTTETELLGEGGVSSHILASQEGKQAPSLPDKLQEPPPRVIVLLECLEVPRKALDALRKECNLDFG